MVGVDWWDAVGCTQSAAEDGIGNTFYFLLVLFKKIQMKLKYKF